MAVYGGRKSGFRNQPRQFAALVKFKTSGAQSSPGGTVCAKALWRAVSRQPPDDIRECRMVMCALVSAAIKIEDAVSLLFFGKMDETSRSFSGVVSYGTASSGKQ